MQLQRKIGSIGLLATALGGVVGSGWLFGPMYAAQIAGPAAVFSWILGGILMLCIALTFAELSAAFPLAGGMVRFSDMSHGPIVGFVLGWIVWLSSVVVAPIETLALLQYASNYLPNIMQNVGGIAVLTHLGMLFAALLMFFMCALNAVGAKFFSRTTVTIGFIKLIVPILTLIVLFKLDFHVNNFTDAQGFMPFGWKGIVTALPLGGVIFSFIGYSPAIQLAEEAKRPQFAIPLAVIGAVLGCIVLYTLLQISFVGAVQPGFLTHGWQHLSFPGDHGPFAGILTAFGIMWLVMIIYADAAISPFGTAYIYVAGTARTAYAMAEIGLLPKFMQKLNQFGVPVRTIALNYIVGLLLFLPFPGWQSMVGFLVSCFVVSYSIGPIALYCLRQQQPNVVRPFKLPFFRVMTLIAFYVCNLLVFWTGWATVSKLFFAMLVGFIVFFYRYLTDKSDRWQGYWKKSWWLVVYLIAITVISYLGSFGGGRNLIHFGPDFFVLAILTVVIFAWAVRSGKSHTS